MFGYSPLIDPILQHRHLIRSVKITFLLNDFLWSEFHLEGGGGTLIGYGQGCSSYLLGGQSCSCICCRGIDSENHMYIWITKVTLF